MAKQKSTRQIIADLGGVQAVADQLGVSYCTVDNWQRPWRRISAHHWHDILALAAQSKSHWINLDLLKTATGAAKAKK